MSDRVTKIKFLSYLELINLIASYAFSTLIIGKIGPKISSVMTGSVGFTLCTMVGSMNRSLMSIFPPTAIWASFNIALKRLKK